MATMVTTHTMLLVVKNFEGVTTSVEAEVGAQKKDAAGAVTEAEASAQKHQWTCREESGELLLLM